MASGGQSGRLRGELTEFVGRRAELALVRQTLGTARLVTLIGPGGIGKTRLAIEAASSAQRAFGDGAWLAELGALRDPALLVPEVARSLGLSDRSARWAVAGLSDYLAGRQVLLVLDQCEHLADACAVIADALLRGCPRLRIMATSRHVLGVAGEVTLTVPPMTVPDDCPPAAAGELLQYEAVRLFTDRAGAVQPGFTLDAASGPAVAGVCRRLDGIPLAIELAAVRLRSLSLRQILSRLDSRFPLLSGGGPADQPHHRALQATLEWSYDLLTEAEQSMWRRVSVFAGSFDLDAAEAVCAVGRVAPGEIVDLIDALVAKSILLRSGESSARYRLLDTIGEFGLHKLRGRGNERRLRLRHFRWYTGLAARQEAFGRQRAPWIAALNTDHENLRAALEFSLCEPSQVAAGAEMACDLWRYWETHGHLTEGRRILSAALDRLDQGAAARPRALWVAGYLALVQDDLPAARTLLEDALTAARLASDASSLAYASTLLGLVRYGTGAVGEGRDMAEAALGLHRRSGDQIGEMLALSQIGYICLCSGELRAAADRYRECARLAESTGKVWYETYARWGLGVVAWLLDNHDAAVVQVRAALRAAHDSGDQIGMALGLDTLGWIAASQHQQARALTLLVAADSGWAAIPAVLPAALREHHDSALDAARHALPDSASRAALAHGSAMSAAEAVAFALGDATQPTSRPEARQQGANAGPLTRREREVAALVARGLSNSQIAAELVISARTVETHVQHIMDKLGFRTRAQIAAWSAGH